MGNVPQRDEKRDKALIADYKAGIFSTVEMVGKYKISMTRVYQILNHYGVDRLKKKKDQEESA